MEKEPTITTTNTTTQDDQNPCVKLEQSPRKVAATSAAGGAGDRQKRDEWSEGAVTSLLEAYESKWILRNRAKLKGQDWEDVAKFVSARGNSAKSPKTQTQCKNKIESMKKRYRSESATADTTSSWPLFSRLDQLLRGTGPPTQLPALEVAVPSPPPAAPVLDSSLPQPRPQPQLQQLPQYQQEHAVEIAQNSQESNGVEPMMIKEDDEEAPKLSDQVSDKNNNEEHLVETDSSTPALYSNDKDGPVLKNARLKRKRRRREDGCSWDDVAESIRWLADAVVRSEQTRMETMRELERMRMEAEAKRGEMDLKRTEIIANTQLEIARIFASVASGKNVDSSLRIGRS